MNTVPTESSSSLLTQLFFVVVATVLAGGLGYIAANGLKSSQKTPDTISTPGSQQSRTGPSSKEPCDDCEKRNLPTP